MVGLADLSMLSDYPWNKVNESLYVLYVYKYVLCSTNNTAFKVQIFSMAVFQKKDAKILKS